jgi:hypothetical protein
MEIPSTSGGIFSCFFSLLWASSQLLPQNCYILEPQRVNGEKRRGKRKQRKNKQKKKKEKKQRIKKITLYYYYPF